MKSIKEKIIKILNYIYLRCVCVKNKKIVFVVGTEDYGNIGDHHIAISEIEYIKNVLGNCHVEEITSSEFYNKIWGLKKVIRDTDIICTQGGGNFGNQYLDAEVKRRHIIDSFPDNKIIIFPQTVFYENNEEGKSELAKTKQSIDRHKKLYLFTREASSYQIAKELFDTKVFLVPDIVLFSHYDIGTEGRENITLCLRHDVERKITDKEENYITDVVKKYSKNIIHTDTQLSYFVKKPNRDSEVQKVINTIKTSKLVITDRLHGMVFCAITGTPCIVMSNYNHKVTGVYKWIEDLKYITFLSDLDNLDQIVNELIGLDKEAIQYPYERMEENYLPLKEVLVNE